MLNVADQPRESTHPAVPDSLRDLFEGINLPTAFAALNWYLNGAALIAEGVVRGFGDTLSPAASPIGAELLVGMLQDRDVTREQALALYASLTVPSQRAAGSTS